MDTIVMAKKKIGRPRTSVRHDVNIKFDRVLAGQARAIANGMGISMAEYLSELARPGIHRDYARLLRDLEGGDE
jgi:hypothetical protein